MALPPSTSSGGSSPLGALRGSDLLLILILVLLAMRVLGLIAGDWLNALEHQTDPSGTDVLVVIMLLLVTQNAMTIGAVYLVALHLRGLSWSDLGLRPAPHGAYSRAMGLALLALPVTFAIEAMMQRLIGGSPVNPQIGMVAPAGFSWFGLIGMLALVGALAPFAEELAFRGVLYRWLRDRWGVAPAVAASSLAFALLHGIPFLIPVIVLLGAMLALIYEYSRSLWPAVVAHGVYNSITIVLLYALLAQGPAPG